MGSISDLEHMLETDDCVCICIGSGSLSQTDKVK
jgi:hypothetical protein